MFLFSNRNINWSLREYKMLWELIDYSNLGFYFRVVNFLVIYGKLYVFLVGILIFLIFF